MLKYIRSIMQQVRCTNCGSTAIITEGGEFCKCEACGSTFSVSRAAEFSKVVLDHTQDIRAWREYLGKQLRLQQESVKARDYSGVKLFAEKILSVLPDDFCALYYAALADRYADNDTAYVDFLANADFRGVTADERREVADSVIATAEPKYVDSIKDFIRRAYPEHYGNYFSIVDRNIKSYIQRLGYAKPAERDVFICHRTAAPDQDIADAICTRLEERGLRCWIAPRNILAGSQNYERDIIKGVENCRIFLVVTSFKSIYSEDCEKELKAAVLADKALYSFRIDDTEYDGAFKRALSSVQWLDARDDPYAHLEQLVVDIKGMLAEDEREKAALEEKRFAARETERKEQELQRARDRERLDRLEKMMNGEAAATAVPAYNYRAKLKRAEIEAQSGNFSRAAELADQVLDIDPECAQAWWVLLLCDYRAAGDAALEEKGVDFTVDRNFVNAERFADGEMLRRIEDAVGGLRVRAVKTVNAALDEAERMFAAEDFNGLDNALKGCARSFADENGIIFKKFPDIASRYFWLKLWAKYGQTPLVCVEDITRETEYKTALCYASPAQASEYEKARDTVSKNAVLFLRERSKNRANDGKLVDYLVDNKGILPIDTYNYYSSLLYFRKMLDQLNMTETQLKASTVDITTNEYFMLAQSLATDAQQEEYARLTETLDKNRAQKTEREENERRKKENEKARIARKSKSSRIAKAVISSVSAGIAYLLFLLGLIVLSEKSIAGAMALFTASSAFEIICAGVGLSTAESKRSCVFAGIGTVLDVITFFIAISFGFDNGACIVFTIAAFIMSVIVLPKCGKNSKNK